MTAPVLAITQPDGSRKYRHPRTGEEVPSVTTVIKNGFFKPALTTWAARKAAEYAVANWQELGHLPVAEKVDRIRFAHERIAGDAGAKGDAVHEAIDAWQKGEAHEAPRGVGSSLNQFIDFVFTERPVFLETEVTLWSRTHQYAGTCDWIAEIGGKIILGDNKTGKGVYPETAVQLAALAGCDFIIREDGTEEEIPALEELVALHIRPRSWRVIPVARREECFAAFLNARALLNWRDNIAPCSLGVA